MSTVFQYKTNKISKKSVYYSGTDTLRQGQPLCYNFDQSNDLDGTAVTDGDGCNSRYLEVEDPSDTNLQWFAGVVGPEDDGRTGPLWLELIEPNGAIVALRTDIECTEGITILAIEDDSQEFTVPLNASEARPVAIAIETIDRSETAGLVLARLDPNLFIYQDHNGTALNVPDEATADVVVNRINLTSAQTSGRFTAFDIKVTLAGAGVSETGYASCLYCEQDIAVAVGGQTPCAAFWTNLTGGTQTEPIFGLQAAIYEDGATLTNCGIVTPLALTCQFADNPKANEHCWIYFENNGTYAPDEIFRANAKGDLSDAAMTGDHAFDSADRCIPVYFQASQETFYIPLMNNKGD